MLQGPFAAALFKAWELEPLNDENLAELPVFPLPSTVLFPGTVLPLHIFEERYRAMVIDAIENDTGIAIAQLKPGREFTDRPAVHEVAGAGRIIHADELPDGRFNILVHGLHRVKLCDELERDKLYRRFRAEYVPAAMPTALEQASACLAKLQSCVLSLQTSVANTDPQLVEVLSATPDPVELADVLSAAVVPDARTQQDLLATNDLNYRIDVLVDALAEVMVQVGEPPRETMLN